MLNLDNAIISKCILHKVGNSHASEPSIFSNALLNLDEYKKTELKKVCTKVFKQPIPTNQFVHTINLQQNVVFKLAESIFSDSVDFKLNSIQLVKYLFDQSTHYSIKAGEVFIIKLENVSYNEMQSDAIGIFKIEHVTNFIQPKYEDKSYSIMFENGIIGKNIEKACIIFNYDYDEGFNVFSFEKNSADTQYWNKNFLNIKRKENDYNIAIAYGSSGVLNKVNKATLQALATKCPHWEGMCVYQARQLYNVYTANQGLAMLPFYDDCNNTGLYKTDETNKRVFGSDVNLFPNRNNGDFYLDFEDKTLQTAQVKITDMMGKIIFNNNVSLIAGFGLCQISSLPGMYIVSIQAVGQAVVIKKIIVE